MLALLLYAFGKSWRCWQNWLVRKSWFRVYVFMMNAARFGVGMQGVAMCERAYQAAVIYAKQRIQGYDLHDSKLSVPIIQHQIYDAF